MSQFKLVAFDLDGTLVNSLPDLTSAINEALNSIGLLDVTEKQVFEWVGNGTRKMIERAINFVCERDERILSDFDINSLHDTFSSAYAKNFCNKSCLYPQVKDTLINLKNLGYKLAIVTNKQTCYIAPILESLDISQYFDEVLGEQSLPAVKPHPAPIYYLCGKFGLYPKQILFVGDSHNDITAANLAGCQVVGLSYGYSQTPINTFNPDWTMDNFGDLLQILK